MKKIVGLIVIVALLLGTAVGCKTASSEQVYTEVSVGPMTISIPDDWQRPGELDEVIRNSLGPVSPELVQYLLMDAYKPPTGDFALVLIVMNYSEIVEAGGMIWKGWEAQLEAEYATEESYLSMFLAGFFSAGAEEVTQTLTLSRTIHGMKAIEGRCTFEQEGVASQANLLLSFAEYDLGAVFLVGRESAVAEYEDVWETIRDSVEFSY